MNPDKNTEGYVEVNIQDLRLQPGTELTLSDKTGRTLGHQAQYVAAFSGKSILIALLVDNPNRIEIRTGETYLIKGFTGKYDFTFASQVMLVDAPQFNAKFSYPSSVSVKFVRGHMRARAELPATASAAGVDKPAAIVIRELSAAGVSIDSSMTLGNAGDKITLSFQVIFENKKINLNLNSIIRHSAESGSDGKLRTGVEFENPTQNEKLMLYYFAISLSEAAEML